MSREHASGKNQCYNGGSSNMTIRTLLRLSFESAGPSMLSLIWTSPVFYIAGFLHHQLSTAPSACHTIVHLYRNFIEHQNHETIQRAFLSALPISRSVLGQKWLRSPTGILIAMRISAAIMAKVMYHPRHPTTNSNAPPA